MVFFAASTLAASRNTASPCLRAWATASMVAASALPLLLQIHTQGAQVRFQPRHCFQPQQGLGQLDARRLGRFPFPQGVVAGRGQVDLDLVETSLQGRQVRLQCHGRIVLVLDVGALPLVFSRQVRRFLLLLGQRRFRLAQFLAHEVEIGTLQDGRQGERGLHLPLLGRFPGLQQLVDGPHAPGVAQSLADPARRRLAAGDFHRVRRGGDRQVWPAAKQPRDGLERHWGG